MTEIFEMILKRIKKLHFIYLFLYSRGAPAKATHARTQTHQHGTAHSEG
jgi:hypothetical protein